MLLKKRMPSIDVIITKQELKDSEIYGLLKNSSKKNCSKFYIVCFWMFCGKMFHMLQTMHLGLISIVFIVRFLSTGFLKIERMIRPHL